MQASMSMSIPESTAGIGQSTKTEARHKVVRGQKDGLSEAAAEMLEAVTKLPSPAPLQVQTGTCCANGRIFVSVQTHDTQPKRSDLKRAH